jgi:hypothetical protein
MKKNKLIFLLIPIIFIVYFFVSNTKPKPFGDDTFHVEAKIFANEILGSKRLSSEIFTKAPGPVIYYGLIYSLGNNKNWTDANYYFAAVFWNFLWLFVSVFMIQKLINYFIDSSFYLSTILAFVLVPVTFYYAQSVTAEPLAFLMVTLFVYSLITYFETSKWRLKWFSIFLHIISIIGFVMTRPNGILIIPVELVFIFILIRLDNNRKFNYYSLLVALIISFFTFLIITTQLVSNHGRNKIVSTLEKSSQNSYFYHVALHGRFQYRNEPLDWRFWDNSTRIGSLDYANYVLVSDSLDNAVLDVNDNTSVKSWIIKDIIANKFIFMRQVLVRFVVGNILIINSKSPEKFKVGSLHGKYLFFIIHIVLNILNFIFIIALFIFFNRYFKNRKYILILLSPYFSLIIFHSLVYMEQRYLFPARPIFILSFIIISNSLFINYRNKGFRIFTRLKQ